MPYVACSDCGMQSYAAAPYALAANCPFCDARLPVRPAAARSAPRRSQPSWPSPFTAGVMAREVGET